MPVFSLMFIDFSKNQLALALRAVQTGGYATACTALSAEEKAIIYHYSYQGSEEIKAPVRQKDGLNDEPLGMGLAAALAKLPLYDGLVFSAELWDEVELSALLMRFAIDPSAFAKAKTVKRWPTFLSASQTRRVAVDHQNFGKKNCILSILSKNGRHIDALSHRGINGHDPAAGEREVLFLPNTRFHIVSVLPATATTELEIGLVEI